MTTPVERHRAIVTATNIATKQGIRLGLDPARTVDIFGVIEDERIWLLFEELKDLFGFFQRDEEVAGIALHAGHPQSLQRFTAAHEYGHYVLGHLASQDAGEEVYGQGDLPVQEYEAQAFAAEFLMPLALVNRALARLSLPEEPYDLDALGVYQLSLEIGASYRATIARLNQLNKITFERARELAEHKLMDLKIEIGAGERPENSRAAVWSLDDAQRGRRVEMLVEDELHVRLPELPSSGYRWVPRSDWGGEMKMLGDELEEPNGETRLGGAMTRHLWLRAQEPGAGHLKLALVREWQGEDSAAADTLSVPLKIALTHNTAETDRALAPAQRRGLLAAG